MKELLTPRTLLQFLLASANGTKSRLRITFGAAKLADAFHHFATPRIKELSTLLAQRTLPNNPAFHAEAIDRNVRIDLSIPSDLTLIYDLHVRHFFQNLDQNVRNHHDGPRRKTIHAELEVIASCKVAHRKKRQRSEPI